MRSRLQAVQARIDPELLFELLDAVRRSYAIEPSHAEKVLDELTSFLRSALPRLRDDSSSVPREVGLARHYVQLRSMATQGLTAQFRIDREVLRLVAEVSAEALHARFPPGVVLPLLDDVLRACPGTCRLVVRRHADDCVLALTLPGRPAEAVVARVRELLANVHGRAAALVLQTAGSEVTVTVRLPYECA